MNLERNIQEVAPMTILSYSRDTIGAMLPPLIKGGGGLASVPQAALRQNLQPVMTALEGLNAELLLDLHSTSQGPRVAEGYVDLLAFCIVAFVGRTPLTVLPFSFCEPQPLRKINL
jgi:hypothetical protein